MFILTGLWRIYSLTGSREALSDITEFGPGHKWFAFISLQFCFRSFLYSTPIDKEILIIAFQHTRSKDRTLLMGSIQPRLICSFITVSWYFRACFLTVNSHLLCQCIICEVKCVAELWRCWCKCSFSKSEVYSWKGSGYVRVRVLKGRKQNVLCVFVGP